MVTLLGEDRVECLEVTARELHALRREVGGADRCYHLLDSPEITDAQYDVLFRRLVPPAAVTRRADAPARPVLATAAALWVWALWFLWWSGRSEA